jgi:hypothetical protein
MKGKEMKNSKTSENFTRALEIIAEVQQHEDKFDAVSSLGRKKPRRFGCCI